MANPIKLSINGAGGRMGQAIIKLASNNSAFEIVEMIDRKSEKIPGPLDTVTKHQGEADVLIDFSLPEGFRARLAECVEHKTAFVSGTTGLSNEDLMALDEAAKTIPVMQAGNYSTGVNLLCELVQQAAKALANYDVEIVEMHHNQKVDAPSGTANMLLSAACKGLERDPPEVVQHGREGHTGKRTATEIGMHALRGGDVFGDHSVIFAGPGERVELTHKASNRDTFASGSLKAAAFLANKKPGRYYVKDVVLG